MCDVITPTVMAVMAIASSAVSVYAQQQTAKAQSKAIGVQQDNEQEEAQAAAEEALGDRIKEARSKRSRARVAAGESGAMGASFAAMINQSLSDSNQDAAKISKNLGFAQRAIDDRANSALSSIRSPSALEAGLTIANAGAQGYNTGLEIRDRNSGEPSSPTPPPPKPKSAAARGT